MRRFTFFSCLLFAFSGVTTSSAAAECGAPLNFEAQRLHSSETISFCEHFKDKTLLFVNTASQCGFTHQFEQLEALYERYRPLGLEIIGFPSNDFAQEHQDTGKIAEICYRNFGVSFTMLQPSSVKGENANAVFDWLAQQSAKPPGWNFYKYLVAPDGRFVDTYPSSSSPVGGRLEKSRASGPESSTVNNSPAN